MSCRSASNDNSKQFPILTLSEREKDLIERAFISGILKCEKRKKEQEKYMNGNAYTIFSQTLDSRSSNEIDIEDLFAFDEDITGYNRSLFFLKKQDSKEEM